MTKAAELTVPFGPNDDWELTVHFEPVAGRYSCSRLELTPSPFADDPPPEGITSRLLHSIKMGALLEQFTDSIKAEERFFERIPAYKPPKTRRGPNGLPDAHYRRMARLYLDAFSIAPRRPIREAMDRLRADGGFYSQATVRDWVHEARRRGYLTEPGRGIAGGAATEKLLREERRDTNQKRSSKKPRRA